jgi:hypothetical protein
MGCTPPKINVRAGVDMSAKGLRVFVVEDEAMIRMMVADMLEELGHITAAEAGRLDQALPACPVNRFRRRHPGREPRRENHHAGGAVDRRPRSPDHLCDQLWRGGCAGGI